ncbi:conjugal transfer protein, partial [Natronococcus sp. JC468]|uniref:VirB4 family type IV secretion system protein n=1 Tax=Natronococcus sp. JC468 TaxID=1961921 RepID=UPI00143A8290
MTEQPSDSGTDHKVIHTGSSAQVVLGVSKLELLGAVFPAGVIWFIGGQMVPGTLGSLMYLPAIVWLLAGIGFIAAKPPWMGARQYTETVFRRIGSQSTMLFERNPDDSGIDHPTNNSLRARAARLALVPLRWTNALFSVGLESRSETPDEKSDGPTRTQDFVQFKRAYSGTPAVETDEGHVVGAIRISPANMVTSGEDEWQRQARFYAKVLDTAVKGNIQIAEYMRMVDYTPRIERYAKRREEIVTTADGEAPPGEVDYEDLEFGKQVLADLCEERADVVSLYDLSTYTVDPYLIVEVKPEDVVSEDDVEGGLASVPVIGRIYSHLKVRELKREGEHTPQMIDLLEDRLDTVADAIRRLEDVSGHPIPSSELSQVAADHYQAANAYAHESYSSLVRQTPIPTPDTSNSVHGVETGETSDPEYNLTYSHLDVEADRDPRTTLSKRHNQLAVADQTAAPDGESEATSAETEAATDGGTTAEPADVETVSPTDGPGTADIALTDAELEEQYISLLAPEVVERSWIGDGNGGDHLKIDGEIYTATLFISSYPKDPPQGFLEPILQFDDAEVQTNVVTHVETIDQDKAERELEDYADSLRKRYNRVKDSRFEMFASRYEEEADETQSALDSFLQSEHDMFEAQTYIEVRSFDPDALKRAIRSIRSKMSDMSAEVAVLRNNHDLGHQTVAPACQDKVGQKVKLRAEGLAAMNPWTTTNLYDPSGVEIAENMATNEPLSVDVYDRDAGYNWFIVGKTGAGKTVTASQYLWRYKTDNPDSFMAVIDPLQEFANLQEIFGGERIVVGSTNINPFDISPTPEDKLDAVGHGAPYREWLNSGLDFVALYYQMQGFDFSQYRAIWTKAIKQAGREKGITEDPKTHDPDYRKKQGKDGTAPTMTDVMEIISDMSRDGSEFVEDPDNESRVEDREEKATTVINNHVEPFREGGHLEHLAHQTEVDLSDTDFVYADLQLKEGDEEGGGLM